MNNNERELWIMNNEVLYLAWRSTGLSIAKYMKQYRENIDKYIKTATLRQNLKQQASSLYSRHTKQISNL